MWNNPLNNIDPSGYALRSFLPSSGSFNSDGDGDGDSDEDTGENAYENYSPNKKAWHLYVEGPNLLCAAKLKCSAEDMKSYNSRFVYPGQDPSTQAKNLSVNTVYDPRNGLEAGDALSRVSKDGLTVTNITLEEHVLYDGQITRTVYRGNDGAWYAVTLGIGNNDGLLSGLKALINEWQGPKIFNLVDQQMREYIEANHQ